ncbi:glycosyltransferase [Devosia sp.]|uniref:glycosyltransferase n=1 Tax=Devosia sp. TaxID=1871048 RepID=UPI003A941DDD
MASRETIVFHVPTLRGGGAERVWVLMANELAARGHDVTLFTWNGEGPNAALRSDGVRLVDLGLEVKGDGFGKTGTLRGLLSSIAFIIEHRPAALYSAPEFANLMMALALIASFSRAKFFPSFHAAASIPTERIGSQIASFLARLVTLRATRAIAVSAGVGRDLEARGIPSRKVAVIHNPLPPARSGETTPYPWQDALAEMGSGPVVATAGRLVGVKDQATLLRGFATLRAERPARLVIFGAGPLEASLKQQANDLGIATSVLFAGYVNDPEAIYAAADLFVLTSTSEGFGNVLVEAMAAGVPVVSTDCEHGPREILADGRYGGLVPVGDAEALAVAMAKMLDAPTGVDLLQQRAADFTPQRIGDRYEALLDA